MLFVAYCNGSTAQGRLGEWFNQKKTQTKYLIQQIAALNIYIKYLEKGYDIAKKGLNTIADLKQGEFDLHTDYFSSLKRVNPSVQHYAKVAFTISFAVSTSRVCSTTLSFVNNSTFFSAAEKKYFQSVLDKIKSDVTGHLTDLTQLLTNNELQLKDDERIQRIEHICADIQKVYTISKSFENQVKSLSDIRSRQINDNLKIGQLHNLSIN
jgi:hypothetical protein